MYYSETWHTKGMSTSSQQYQPGNNHLTGELSIVSPSDDTSTHLRGSNYYITYYKLYQAILYCKLIKNILFEIKEVMINNKLKKYLLC